jgi:sulfate permease, SulP family
MRLALDVGSVAMIVVMRRYRPNWPGMLIAVATCEILAAIFRLSVDTIGSRFGDVPQGLPAPQLAPLSLQLVRQVLPAALSFTLLGGIESLLSAKVADGMTGRKHRSNMELVAQGVANIASALFVGVAVTGALEGNFQELT